MMKWFVSVKSFPVRIFLVALILRLAPVIVLRTMGIGLDDMFQYDMLARSLAEGNGYRWYAEQDLRMLEPYVDFDLEGVDYDPVRGVPSSFRAPLYPAFLAVVYWLTGGGAGRFLWARLAQTLLGGLLAPLTYWVGLRLIPDRQGEGAGRKQRAVKVSAWVVACYPLLVFYPFGLATENLFFPLTMGALLFLLKGAETGRKMELALAGLFLGLAALTRSVILPFVGLAVLWAWFLLKNRRGAMLMAAVVVVVVTPWVVRNSILHQRLSGIESSMGYNLYVGYHPESNGSFTFGVSLDLLSILDDAERDRSGTQQAMTFIREDPGRFVPLMLNRASYFFGLEKRVLVYFYANNFLGFIPRSLLAGLAIVLFVPFVVVAGSVPLGLAQLRGKEKASLIWLFLLAYITPHVLILAEDRFHLALVPVFAILAAHCWAGDWAGVRELGARPRWGRVILWVALAVTVVLVFNWVWEIWRDAELLVRLFGPGGNILYLPY